MLCFGCHVVPLQVHRYIVLDIDICKAIGVGQVLVSRQFQAYLSTEPVRQQLAKSSGSNFDADSTPVLIKYDNEYKAVFGMIKAAEVGAIWGGVGGVFFCGGGNRCTDACTNFTPVATKHHHKYKAACGVVKTARWVVLRAKT